MRIYRQKCPHDRRAKKKYDADHREEKCLKRRVRKKQEAIDRICEEWNSNAPVRNRSPSKDHPWRGKGESKRDVESKIKFTGDKTR